MTKKPRVLQFKHESATLTFTDWKDGTASISDVFSAEKRKGHATNLLNEITSFADKKGLILLTAAEAYGEEPRMSTNQLVTFYERFGFVAIGDDPEYMFMERLPR
jgi:GNAT superfamily N-acetyltransferase